MVPHPSPPIAFKVLTVNVHKGFTSFNRRFILHELREAVRKVEADLVFLQEVLGTHRRHASRFSNFPQVPHYEFLADSIWPQYAYGRNAVAPEDSYGNAVLSHFPIVHSHNHRLSHERIDPQRGLLHCIVDKGGQGRVHLMCVHLGLLESDRQHQLDRLCEIVAAEVPAGEPLIVAGDFNDWRLRADRKLAQRGLSEVFREAFGRHARSFPAGLPLLRLDRIYVRDVSAMLPIPMPRHPWSRLSDHAPLAAAVRLRGAP